MNFGPPPRQPTHTSTLQHSRRPSLERSDKRGPPGPARGVSELLKSAGQVLAAMALVAYVVLLLHKGWIDFSALSAAHPGAEFWPALGRHILRVLGGG